LKLVENCAKGDEADTDENFENYLTFAGSSVLVDALIKLAEKERLCCYVLRGHTLVKKVEPENKDTHATTLVFNEWGGRIYCYGEATRLSVRQMPVREIRPVPTIGTKKESKRGKPRVAEIPKELEAADDPAELPPGEYMTSLFRSYEGEWNLESIRYHLLTHGINPSINIAWTRDGPIYTKLWYPGKEGKVVIQAAQLGWQESQAFAKLFSETHTDLPFHMQTRSTLTHEALLFLLN
jgi:hypothetical protein